MPYRYKFLGFFIPLFGKYVVAEINGVVITGFVGYIFQQLVFLRYLLKILPPWKAFKRWGKYEGRHSKTF
jgi:NADH dehydrogenase FAD-containing subunit